MAPHDAPASEGAGARGDGPDLHRDRGQTTVDFLIGIAIFLLAVGFVAAAATGMVAPVTEGQAEIVLADRVADELVGTTLSTAASPRTGGPARLDGHCVRAFFVNGTADAADCAFDPAASLTERVGVSPGRVLNVTVEVADATGDGRLGCVSGAGTIQPCADGGTVLAAGASPPASATVTTATRVATVNGTTVAVVVRAW